MFANFSNLNADFKRFELSTLLVQYYTPPIRWKGDPKGHIGSTDTFFFVLEGECCLVIENEPYILHRGDIAFLPRNKMRLYSTFKNNLSMYEINFNASIDGENWYDALKLKNSNYVVNTSNIDYISKLFEDSIRYEYKKNIYYDLISCINLSAIIKEYITIRYLQDKLMKPFVNIINIMNENLGKTLTLNELANVACMQPNYFLKKFNATYSMPPIAYFNKLKIYHSMSILISTQLPICDVAKQIGIQDASYYVRMFKKYCELTPSEYRQMFNNNQ